MKFAWLDSKVPYLKSHTIGQEFKKYILISEDAGRKGNLDSLDDMLTHMDSEMKDVEIKYTKAHAEYLKTETSKVLESLKKESLKQLVMDESVTLKNTRVGFDWDNFPTEFTLGDVTSNSKRLVEEGLPDDSVMSVDTGYTTKDVLKRIKDKHISVEFQETSRTSKMIISIMLPAESANDEHGKNQFWNDKGVAVRGEEPDPAMKKRKGKVSNQTVNAEDFKEAVDELTTEAMLAEGRTGDLTPEEKDSLKEDMVDLVTQKQYKEEFILPFIPQTMANAYEIYDMGLELIFDLSMESKEDFIGETDDEGEVTGESEEEEEVTQMSVKSSVDLEPKLKLVPKTGREERQGLQDRLRPIRGVSQTGRTSDEKYKVYSMARKSYFNFVKARMRELEEAISDIPEASEEV